MGSAKRSCVARLIAIAATMSFTMTASAAPSREAMDLAVRDLGADHDRATAAVYVLQAGGAAAAEAIRDQWPTLSALAQKRAIAALGALVRTEDAAVDALVLAARSDDADVQRQALAALRRNPRYGRQGLVALLYDAQVGDRAAALLARSDPDFAIEPLLVAISEDPGPDRRALRESLAVAVQRADRPTLTIRAWLRSDPPADSVASAALGLSDVDGHDDLLAELVAYAVPQADDFATSWRLLRSAGSAGSSAAIDRWVERQVAEPDAWMLRAAAVDAITARGARERARPALSDAYPRVRLHAATALSGDAGSLVDRATLARKDTWPMVRAAAVTSLRAEKDALPVVVASVDDSMSVVRVAAIEALTPAPHDEGWDRIHRRLRAANEWPHVTAAAIEYAAAHCRTDAAESLFRVVMRAAPSHALTEDLNNAARAIEALRALGTPEANAFIEQLRRTPAVPPTLKLALDQPLPEGGRCTPPDS